MRTTTISGNGVCINSECSVIATAYHVQLAGGGTKLKVAGGQIDKILSLANASDPAKSAMSTDNGRKSLSYNIANDISFLYTKKPVPHKSGVAYSYKVHVGETVIVAFHFGHKVETREAHVIGSNVPLVVGQTRLTDDVVLDISLPPGASGGAVLDERGSLVGMVVLTGILKVKAGDEPVSVAIPVSAIAKALVKLDLVTVRLLSMTYRKRNRGQCSKRM